MRESPPLSLTIRWDKVKWHADGEGLPPGVEGMEAGRHVFAALAFLGSVGQLTAEGVRELAGDLGDDTALLGHHVRAGARSFVDHAYGPYLEAMRYGEAPPVALLEQAWKAWTERFDVAKRPSANAYQKLLTERSPSRDLDGLLTKLDDDPEMPKLLRAALPFIPNDERPLAAMALAFVRGVSHDTVATTTDVALVAKALRYASDAQGRLSAAALLAARAPLEGEFLESLVWAVNLHDEKAGDQALASLTREERAVVRDLAHLLFDDLDERHLAICAMRTVGDATSVALLEAHPATPDEGTVTQYVRGGEHTEPMSADVRRAVVRRVANRIGAPSSRKKSAASKKRVTAKKRVPPKNKPAAKKQPTAKSSVTAKQKMSAPKKSAKPTKTPKRKPRR